MLVPESVYAEWRQYKQGVVPAEVMTQSDWTAALAQLTLTLYQIPQEYDLILTSFCGKVEADATTSIDNAIVKLQTIGGNIIHLHRLSNSTNGAIEYVNRDCEILVPSSTFVLVEADFSGAAAGNSVDFSMTGVQIPRMT